MQDLQAIEKHKRTLAQQTGEAACRTRMLIAELYLRRGDSQTAAWWYLEAARGWWRAAQPFKATVALEKVLRADPGHEEAARLLEELHEKLGLPKTG
ncbi:MAG: hypothetical protein P1V51_14810 [Deltaproteobacteria bacterium]|nr:hypothetical protein [Deltaproteobacteria bacterium]